MDKTQKKIVDGYIQYITEHQKQPKSIDMLMDILKLKEDTFRKYFDSFANLDKTLWKKIFQDTVFELEKEEVYASYSVNEKLLSLYFTWIEKLKPYRDYAKFVINDEKIYELYPGCFEFFKKDYESYVSLLIAQGLETEEISPRKFITDKYVYLLWYQPVSILKFWVKDESQQFEDTDALIEKTVNFSFDLMRSNGFDSFFDLAKFHIQHFKI